MAPIRILHVVTYMGRGGLETMIMNYYRHIDREKIQFDFLVHRDFKADYDDEIEQLGGKIYRVSRLIPWSKNYKNQLNTFFKRHKEYKIIHVHQDCLSSVILKVAKENNIPVRIAHSHNSNQDKNLKYIIKLFYKQFIPKYATHLMACGKEAGDWMFNGKEYQIMNNAIDVSLYTYNEQIAKTKRKELGINEDTFVLGHVGRFFPQKNHHFLIDIFKELHQLNPNSKLLLVGDGELRKEIEDKVKTLNLQDDVIFTGVRSDVNELMQAMDFFIFPSLYEGLGIVLIEAQASGLSCLVTDTLPLECEVINQFERLSLKESSKSWANEILKNKDYIRETDANKLIEAGFDIISNAQWLEDFYIKQWKEND